eukprot:1139496-Pelagomonas_calceolata.AAC.2
MRQGEMSTTLNLPPPSVCAHVSCQSNCSYSEKPAVNQTCSVANAQSWRTADEAGECSDMQCSCTHAR